MGVGFSTKPEMMSDRLIRCPAAFNHRAKDHSLGKIHLFQYVLLVFHENELNLLTSATLKFIMPQTLNLKIVEADNTSKTLPTKSSALSFSGKFHNFYFILWFLLHIFIATLLTN